MSDTYRIAGYFTPELKATLDDWCAQNGFDRNEGLNYILQTMLNVTVDGESGRIATCVKLIESSIKKLEKLSAA